MAINYSDSEKIEREIQAFLKIEENLGSHIDLWETRYDIWAFRYHLCSQRANLLRHLNFEGLQVLELGAGMGGVSRYLAESCQHLHVVEGTQLRYDALKERLRDLTNWSGEVSNLEDFSSPEKFDVVCLIGVLEYSEKYITPRDNLSPFDVVLQVAKKHLKPGGALIVAIENKLGLKYWNSTEDDHTGRMFDGITGYGIGSIARTFNHQQLIRLYKRNGFHAIEQFYPFPDYKIPMTVFHSNAFDLPSEVVAELACSNEFESYGSIRQPLYPDYLAMLEVARANLMQDMANSFLYVGFNGEQTCTKKVLLHKLITNHQKIWHYSKRANGQVLSTFIQDQTNWKVSKQIIAPWKQGPFPLWHAVNETIVNGISLRETLERAAYHHEWQVMFDELLTFLKWLIHGKHYLEGNVFLADAAWQNARKTGQEYILFDQEWHISIDDANYIDLQGWIVFRNILALGLINHYYSRSRPWKSLKELYEQIVEQLGITNNYDSHTKNEAIFHCEIGARDEINLLQKRINTVMSKKRWRQAFITLPQDWTTLMRYCSINLPKLRVLPRIEKRLRRLINK